MIPSFFKKIKPLAELFYALCGKGLGIFPDRKKGEAKMAAPRWRSKTD